MASPKYYTSASNFISAVQGSVDSRTGLFNVNLPLGNFCGNDMMGPSLTLNLLYSPLSTINIGFGKGFQLNLSTYNLTTGQLLLSTGEEYRATPIGNVKQKKLNNFIFKRLNEDIYQIIHKSGIVESLTLVSGNIYVPFEIINGVGRKLHLKWSLEYTPARLTQISDDSDFVMCKIDYPNSTYAETRLTYWPSSLTLRYEVNFRVVNDQLMTVTTDSTNNLTWSFEYDDIGSQRNYRAIVGVKSPTGLEERVNYYSSNSDSMAFPEIAGLASPLPCVQRHELYVGNGQRKSTTLWSYTKKNYLGYDANFNMWHPNEDQMLSILLADYEYGSTADHLDVDGNILYTVIQRYNSYHLLTSETTIRGVKKHIKQMEYYAIVNKDFNDQPEQYALPKKQIEKWHNDEADFRTETTEYEFDEFGNPTRQLTPDGTLSEYTYYNGEDEDCPADPNGFIRYLKYQCVTPPKISQTEPIKTTTHTWTKLDKLHDDGYIVVPRTIQKTIGKSTSLTVNTYNTDRGNASLYGRLIGREVTLKPDLPQAKTFTSSVRTSYHIENNECAETHQFIGYDGLTKTATIVRNIRTAKVRAEISSQGVETTYSYDHFGRISRRTHCPGTKYENNTAWEYSIHEDGPYTVETDAMQNKMKNSFDALGRLQSQQKFDIETNQWYDTYSCIYNELGEIMSGTTMDHLSDNNKRFPLKSDVDYDDWGLKRSVTFSVGRTEQQHVDLVKLNFTMYNEGIADGGTLTSATELTILDEKSKLPISKIIKCVDGEEYSKHAFTWNGVGELWKEEDVLGHITERTYDDYGRVLTQKYSDDTMVSQTYAPHSTGKLISSVSVTGLDANGNIKTWLMGTQTFDSLGRLTKRNVCGRETSYTYAGASSVPSQVKLPSKKVVNYTYIPELGNAISSISVDDITKTFTYDNKTGKPLTADESNNGIENVYSSAGRLLEEVFSSDGHARLTNYTQTINGVPVSYTDIVGKKMQYDLDAHGRVKSITDDSVTVSLTYDPLGHLAVQTVRDPNANSSMITTLQYDEFGRETMRTVADSNGKTLSLSQKWQKNDVLEMRTTKMNNVPTRVEHFVYDKRMRLIKYSASGDALPHDAYGNQMIDQIYSYDALNNIISVITTLPDNSTNKATYLYKENNDPTQLTMVTNTHSKYPAIIQLAYDIEGRMIRDEAGRILSYDALGRLKEVSSGNVKSSTYDYDALNRLIKQKVGENDISRLYYRGSELVNEATSKQREIRFMKLGHKCFAVDDNSDITLIAADRNDSVLWARQGSHTDGKMYNWSPYGNANTTESPLSGFNGERIDRVSGAYHLGNGYRAYNPILMRFNCPDNLSPFGSGGINPYAYCSGDPINNTDPSGHLSVSAIAGIVMGAVGIALTVFTAGTSIAAAGSVIAALEASSVSSLAIGGIGVASDLTSIASGVSENASPEVSAVLGWISLATGLPGTFIHRRMPKNK